MDPTEAHDNDGFGPSGVEIHGGFLSRSESLVGKTARDPSKGLQAGSDSCK